MERKEIRNTKLTDLTEKSENGKLLLSLSRTILSPPHIRPPPSSRGADSTVSNVPRPGGDEDRWATGVSAQKKAGPSLTHSESQKGWPWARSGAQLWSRV